MTKKNKHVKTGLGFTLIEILVALFVFAIVSLLLTGALRTVIDAELATSKNAHRLRELQMVLLMLSRDLEQAVNRPVISAAGKELPAFQGDSRGFSFTHAGLAETLGVRSKTSSLQRKHYFFAQENLARETWPVLDQAASTRALQRVLLNDLTTVGFQYLDGQGRFQPVWPVGNQTAMNQPTSPLPVAVRIYLKFRNWGEISQLYILPYQQAQFEKVNQGSRGDD